MLPTLLLFLLLLQLQHSWSSPAFQTCQDFIQCLITSQNSTGGASFANLIYTPATPNYSTVLQFSIRDPRFNTTLTPKPSVIITPNSLPQIQATVLCSRNHGLQLRIRSGGHDYEGLSYSSRRSNSPFAVLDLVEFRNVTVDVPGKTAWVQSGAILGELYYRIAEKSPNLAFPAGICHTVGVGGHFGGGGYGYLMRKFGLAADNVVDAVVIDSRGRILDRASMGESLFWAIRGGGGNNFGVTIGWKVKLASIPSSVTVFTVLKTLEQNALKLVHRWQSVANKLPEELVINIGLKTISLATPTNTTTATTTATIVAQFSALFLGTSGRLFNLMQSRFPELGVLREDCKEMRWVQAMVFLGGFPSNNSVDVLLDRSINSPFYGPFKYKGKSDYVQHPIPEAPLFKILERLLKIGVGGSGAIAMIPFGGRMDEISDSSIPFPHRAGNLYQVQYLAFWSSGSLEEAERHIDWLRELYDFAAPYVSQNPRSAYVNYRDFDIGMNDDGDQGEGEGEGETTYEEAKVWGEKYFGDNFDRLVHIKTAVDPDNFFRNEQSIPPVPRQQSFQSI